MCVIFACQKKYPSEVLLARGAARNTDGAGVAWVDEKTKLVRWVKGLPSSVDAVKEVLKDIKSFPVLIHYRSASIGPRVKALTHPFPITLTCSTELEGSSKSVLMHNGTWGGWRDTLRTFSLTHKIKLPDGPWSDSRAYAYMAAHLGKAILPLFDLSDRLVVLDGDGRWDTWGDWKKAEDHLEDGFFLSCPLPPPVSQGNHKSNYPNSIHGAGNGTSGSREFWDERDYDAALAAGFSEIGEEEEEDGEEAPTTCVASGGNGGGNRGPLVLPGVETKSGATSETSGSPASSVVALSVIKPLALKPLDITPSRELESPHLLAKILGKRFGEVVTPGELELVYADIRKKNHLPSLERSH